MAHTRDWSSEVPIDHTKFKVIPGAIAALALDIEERLQAFFYGFTSGETSDGIKYLPFWVQTTAPTGAANKVCMYSEDSNSKAALKIKTEDDAEIQLTERDWGLLDDFALSNNTPLRARNAADDGFVELLKANGSNIPTIPDGARLASTAAPTQDYEIPNKKYVDESATTTPTANKPVKMDANAKLPVAALKIYDSGWFAVGLSSNYTKTHNLGTTKVLLTIQIAENSDGSGKFAIAEQSDNYTVQYVGNVYALSTTQVSIRTGGAYIVSTLLSDGSTWRPSSGYYRIIMLALE